MTNPSKPDPGIERARTDAGGTGDKVAAFDPAAVPGQTDAETAGTPTSAVLAANSAQRQQTQNAKSKAAFASFSSGHDPAGHGSGLWWAALVVVLLVLAGLFAGWVSLLGLR